ncbi:MAG: tRNA(Ile)(2)-agmatinylcytidine synthase [Halobacteriales archaeon]|nr:tRNA(Ile)(2)-agmatinylcytidine synthase [Halobacteriales archaeon]
MDAVEQHAVFDDEKTNPGVAFLRGEPSEAELDALARYTVETVREYKTRDEARRVAEENGVRVRGWKNGRGVVGATAAVGASNAFDDWTYELLVYRGREEWGEPRRVAWDSFFDAHEATYPRTWDTVDEETGEVVAVPNTHGPVVYGLRGTFDGVWEANSQVEVEGAERLAVYRTNQGTDAHLVDARAGEVEDGGSYRVEGEVVEEPETREGGHVFFEIEGEDGNHLRCAAFEPTGRFRNTVRALREGDRVVVCGSVSEPRSDGSSTESTKVSEDTLKVEKLRVVSLNRTRHVKPTCCGRRMESAGRGQGYRCRADDCDETAETLVEETVERELEERWYEVPPSARRHLAKPLVRRETT